MAAVAKCNLSKLGIYYNPLKYTQCWFSVLSSHSVEHIFAKKYSQNFDDPKFRTYITSNSLNGSNGRHGIKKFNITMPTCRQYSMNNNEPNPPSRTSLPQLMPFPNIVWPSVLKTIKNWIMINFIIRPYFDNDFVLSEFVVGAKHALQVVSVNMASGDVKTLTGLVANDALTELQQSVSSMSVAQRNEISVLKDDIYLTFPYQVGIMFDETNDEIQKRWVEITMVFHVLRGLKDMQEQGIVPPLNIGVMPEYREKISICNYRFIKEFTQGKESDWTINVVNHFKPADHLED